MPAARGVKRTASKSSATTTSTAPKNKKKRGAIQLDIPTLPKKRGRVLACGQGDVGQLGLGGDVMETSKFKLVTALSDKIVDVVAGGMHTVALDSDGKVWTFGCNDEGALGRQVVGEDGEGTPGVVPLPFAAVRISAGDSHSAALLARGQVYAWGSFRDSHGSMGLVVRGREGKPCREPVTVNVGEPAVAIASGGDHLVILTVSGSVYTLGCGEQGQLGRLSQRSATRDARQGFSALLTAAKVTLKGQASHVWAGYHATFALDATNDKMFAWGLNNYGQLGITGEKRKVALFSPMECDAFSLGGWQQVACGQHHSLALHSGGQVYSVGRCEYGRLGLGDRTTDAEGLEAVPRLQGKQCVSIAAGTCNSFAVTDSGEVFAWGMGSEGQLGTGSCGDATSPTPASLPAPSSTTSVVTACSAGGQHALLLVVDPAAQKDKTPEPVQDTAEQKADDEEEEEEVVQEPEKKKARGTKRGQKRQEQEDEVSSTSSAPASDSKPQKVNGDEKKELPMEVDETDNPTEKKEEPAKEEEKEMEPEQPDKDTETENEKETETETEPEESKEESKPETTDTSSQETTDSESKQEATDKADVEMAESNVNGETEEPSSIAPPESQTKPVEDLIPTPTTLTTTA